MAKRQRGSAEEEYSDKDSGSDFSASTHQRSSRRKAKLARRPSKKKPIPDNDDIDDEGASTSTSVQTRPHRASDHSLSSPAHLRTALLHWYAGVHESRGMPWRKPYNPSLGLEERSQRAYEVWISEIMLQQTQVATVIPYYNRWMEKFPTLKDLASSDIETVNSLWKGLGYYSRAARLLAAAKKAVNELSGRLPDNAKDMEAKIPGIGRYSAGAICSIAYGERVPVLDGNVHRLMSRLLALHAPPKTKPTLDLLWAGAAIMVESAECPGDVNQALIELGSTVCKVREPLCAACPLQEWCAAYQGITCKSQASEIPDMEDMCSLCEPLPAAIENVPVTAYPMKVDRKKAREELDIVNVVEWRGTDNQRWFLLVRRPEGGLLAGLYEFPTSSNVSVASSAEMTMIPHRLLSKVLVHPPLPYSKNGPLSVSDDMATIDKIKPVGDVLHVFSHIKKTYRVQWVQLLGGGVGDEPPALALDSGLIKGDGQRATRKSAKQATEVRNAEASTAKWVRLDEVTDTNVGTGVLKVWNKVKSLWEGDQ